MSINALALKDVDPVAVIDRYLADEKVGAIAESLGVHRSALNQLLLRTVRSQWQSAQMARAITALDEAKDRLEAADNHLALARAREQLRGAQWELERLLRPIYGQQLTIEAEVTHINGDAEQVLVELARSMMFVIEKASAPALPAPIDAEHKAE